MCADFQFKSEFSFMEENQTKWSPLSLLLLRDAEHPAVFMMNPPVFTAATPPQSGVPVLPVPSKTSQKGSYSTVCRLVH